jgi:FAS-associated factor 2
LKEKERETTTAFFHPKHLFTMPSSRTNNRWVEIIVLVLKILLWPVRFFSNLLCPNSDTDGLTPAVAAKAAQNFVSYLRSIHSGTGDLDDWMTTGFAAVKQQAIENNALVFLYLHSPLHSQSREHLSRVICHDSIINWLHEPNITALGVSIHTAQGAQLAQVLQACAYPFCALLQPKGSSISLLLRAEGPALLEWSVDNMLSHLQSSLTRHQVLVSDDLVRRLQREEETNLRRQQDEEYQTALAADQEREAQRALEQKEELQRQQSIDDDKRKEQEALELAKAMLRPEPTSGGAAVRFVLPSGAKINRRFESDETIGTLKAFLTLHFDENGIEMGTIGLSTSFPRQTFNSEDDLSLEDAGLVPQTVLMVQDLDA